MFCEFEHKIFSITTGAFNPLALDIFRAQYHENELFRQYTDTIHTQPYRVGLVEDIPFLPISFFKSRRVQTGKFKPRLIFESSGTTGQQPSRHLLKDPQLYEESASLGFRLFYGDPSDYCILALLPSYLERQHSSLVYMAEKLMEESRHPLGGFFLHEFDSLARILMENERAGQPTLLLGVTYALLDFAAGFAIPLRHTIVMETGGMKGRRQELTREDVHERLKQAFSLPAIHSEYGMTELLSQAYAAEGGRFRTPPWMRILIREDDDPRSVWDASNIPPGESREGLINVIDLANLYSCCFVATDDVGILHSDGQFEVRGRLDHSDLRGCSLMLTEGLER